jgi:hypothetical protein
MGDVAFKSGQRSLSIRTDRTVRTNCEMALRIVLFVPNLSLGQCNNYIHDGAISFPEPAILGKEREALG